MKTLPTSASFPGRGLYSKILCPSIPFMLWPGPAARMGKNKIRMQKFGGNTCRFGRWDNDGGLKNTKATLSVCERDWTGSRSSPLKGFPEYLIAQMDWWPVGQVVCYAEYFRRQAKINIRRILCYYFTKPVCSDKQSICWEGGGNHTKSGWKKYNEKKEHGKPERMNVNWW